MENSEQPIHPTGHTPHGLGLTKREYFAGLAMRGLLSANALYDGKENNKRLCGDAILHADELIKQLNTKP
jgi:hypothetical protein